MNVALNPEQQLAVDHGDGPLLILAGAGSGKTRVLTTRIARLVGDGVPPHRILAVTFTNKAAGVMRSRIAELLGEEPRGLWAGTFHSICARLLRIEADRTDRSRTFTIYDESDSERAIKHAMEEVGLDPRRWSAGAIRARISDAKNVLVTPEEYATTAFDPLSRVVLETYPVYERLLASRNAYDFDDLLVRAVRLLEADEDVRERYSSRFAHVLVDEYQDTNHSQYRLVRALASVHGNLCVVGDDDQSIYGWRGADVRNILDFERDFPGTAVVRLEQNYRSTAAILEIANAVISRNQARKEKRLHTQRATGDRVIVALQRDERAEALWTVREIENLRGRFAAGEIGILYRTNSQSRAYEDALRGARIPYRIVGGIRFYERREIKDVLAYLQVAVNPLDDAAFLRAVGWPRRGVGNVSIERLRAAGGAGGLLEAASDAANIPGLPRAAAKSLVEFAGGIRALQQLAAEAGAAEVVEECVRGFGLRAALEEEEDGEDRIANIEELIAAIVSFEPENPAEEPPDATETELFLQHVSLLSDIDQYDPEEGAVSLMTLHNAKGLEFPVVFVGGVEEGLLPLARSAETPEGLEEERRLFYVGVTRAMDRLYLTHATRRWRVGTVQPSMPSSFLEELPGEAVDRRLSGLSARSIGGSGRHRPEADSFGRKTQRDFTASVARAPSTSTDNGSGDATAYAWRRDAGKGGRELEYDYSESQDELALTAGTRVVHPRFGAGTVVSVSGEGGRAKARIDFDDEGRMTVLVAHARLRPAGS